jgi:guanylate kinase
MYKIIAVIGEAGTGKDSLMQTILGLQPDLHEIVSCTTRPKREGEVHGVNYFYYTPEQFGDMVLHDEMLECTVFNDWFYGTSYDSLRSDCVNIGVFNPTAVEALAARPDVDIEIIRVCAAPKTRLLRQLNREDNPCVDEIIRRYGTDKIDFDGVEHDFECYAVWNGEGTNLIGLAETILYTLRDWMRLGKID